jgi:hypothetical protein
MFTAFWQSTRETILTGLDDFINMTTRESFTYPRLIAGNAREKMIGGGSYIRDRAFFKGNKTFRRINPDAKVSYINPQQGKDWVAPWSIAVAQTGWNLWEFDLNFDDLNIDAQSHVFKRVRTGKKMDLYSDIAESMDDECWGVPDKSLMEVTVNAGAPYSLAVFVNEFEYGLPQATDQPGGAWTTVQGIDPSAADVAGRWHPYARGYTYNATTTPGTTSFFSTFTLAFLRTTFDRLPHYEQWSDKTSSPSAIFTQTQGVVNFEHALRVNQDYFRGEGKVSGEDPSYMGPTFRNIPIQHLSALDTAAIYPTGASDALGTWDSVANVTHGLNNPTTHTAAGGGIGYAGPRYYGVKGQYICPYFHGEKYMELESPFRLSAIGQHFNFVQLCKITNNLACRSRRDHFILYPGGTDTVDAAA